MNTIDLGVENRLHPASAIEAFLKKLAAAAYHGADRRDSERHGVIVSVAAIPVDEGFRPTGKAFMGITRDVSIEGISLVHHRPIAAKYLALDLSEGDGQAMHVIMEVLRCHNVGPYFEVAGRFVTKPE